MRKSFNQVGSIIIPAILNSYSVVFFFNNWFFSIVILAITFFNVLAGLSGLIAVLVTVAIAETMGFDKSRLKQGIYSFNALLTGIGLGTFFDPGLVYFIVLLLAVLFCLIVSVILSNWLGKYGLPFLSIPFVLSFWLILLPSGQLSNLGLSQRNIFWMNELYATGGKPLLDFFQTIENLPLNKMVIVYLRSLSSVFFQDNLITGILLAAALLITSRISFLLSVIGFVTAYLFASLIGSEMASFSFYNIGANYILVAIAVGGFYTIPSRYSFLWVILLVPLTSLIILFLNKLSTFIQLPFLSLPFSIVVISFLFFLVSRAKAGKLILTRFQNYSPEINLYSYKSAVERNSGYLYFPLRLPFWGEWKISQGYEGEHTHKGEWSSAFDFVLVDEMNKSFGKSKQTCEDFFCYNKPVIAPADGEIVELTDRIYDNEPGKVNTIQNWGNTIIIKHLNDLYTQMSHLKPGTFKVKKGDFIRQGEILASCGNSGRSSEPHLHFQVQLTPTHGAKTYPYPFSYYFQKNGNESRLKSFSTPAEGEHISNVETNILLKEAFDFQPGIIMKMKYTSGNLENVESWEVMTDSYNYKYLYSIETQSIAYFINDGTMFYFTSFFGDHKSLLYYFYITAYRVLLGYYENIELNDLFPLHMMRMRSVTSWLHDFVAPFYHFMQVHYSIKPLWSDSPVNPNEMKFESRTYYSFFNRIQQSGKGNIIVAENRIKEFSFELNNKKIWAQRTDF